MSRPAINNQKELQSEALGIALIAFYEVQQTGGDPFQVMHEIVEGHESVINTHQATILCRECDCRGAETQLHENDYKPADLSDYVTKLAYLILYNESCKKYGEL